MDAADLGGQEDPSHDLRARAMQRRVLQRKLARSTGEAAQQGGGEMAGPAPARGGGQQLPGAVRGQMEGAFGEDFSSVRVHEGPEAEEVGAHAFAQGEDMHFAPGQLDPDSPHGQEMIGHELAHVVQQRQGRVAAPQGFGGAINGDPSLEAEADEKGKKAARGEPAGGAGGPAGGAAGAKDAPVQRKLMTAAAFKDATYNRMGTRSGTGMEKIDNALAQYHGQKFEGDNADQLKIQALQGIYTLLDQWLANPAYKDVAAQRKKGVQYLKKQVTDDIAEARSKLGGGPASGKKPVEQMQKDGVAEPGVLDTIGSGLAATPGAVASVSNPGRQLASGGAAAADKLNKAKLNNSSSVKEGSMITKDVAAGVGLIGVGKAASDLMDLHDEPEARTRAGQQLQGDKRAAASMGLMSASAGELGAVMATTGEHGATMAGAGIGIGVDVALGVAKTVDQGITASRAGDANKQIKAHQEEEAAKVPAQKLELYLQLHKLHLDGKFIAVGDADPQLMVGTVVMNLSQAKSIYQEMRHEAALATYLKAKQISEISAYTKGCVTTKVILSAVETIGTALDFAGTFTAGADGGITKMVGKGIKYGAKGARGVVTGLRKMDKITELGRLKTLIDGKERGSSWKAQMMFLDVDSKLAEMRERLSGRFRTGKAEVKWKESIDNVGSKDAYDQEEIQSLQLAREERYARDLIETAIEGGGADQENAIKLLHALAIPVPKKETYDRYDEAQKEESMTAMIALYQRAVAP